MTAAERALAHFDQISEAPDAIPRLRRFVLDLAVRGRLVEGGSIQQDFIGSIGRSPPDYPHAIPIPWSWRTVAEIAQCRLGKMLDKAKNRGTLRPYLRNVNVRWFDFDLDNLLEMKFEDSELDEFSLRPGDVLVCEGGEPGRAAVWQHPNHQIYFQKAIHRVRCGPDVNPQFFVNALRAAANDGRLATYFTGVGIKHLTGRGLASFTFPVPPIVEQHLIVAKIGELMALCDRLEAAQKERENRRDRLVSASLARFSQPADTPSFREHARFHLQHLPHMAIRGEHIRPMRELLLDLAVRGLLVRQEPRETDGDNDFEVGATRSRLESVPHLPIGWRLGTLAQMAETIVDCPHSTPRWTSAGNLCVRTNQFRPGRLDLSASRFVSEATYIERIQRLKPREDDILYSREGGILGVACRVPAGVELCLGQRMMLIRAGRLTRPDYLELVLNSPLITAIAKKKTTGGAAPRINVATVKAYQIPVPPLPEQQRIVARVEHLMALCDRLEAQLEAGRAAQAALLEATLRDALTGGAQTQLSAGELA